MIILNLDDEVDFIVKVLGCSKVAARDFVYLEDEYFDKLGLNVYESTPTEFLSSNVVVEEQEMLLFIASHSTNLDLQMCEQIVAVEHEYLKELGIMK